MNATTSILGRRVIEMLDVGRRHVWSINQVYRWLVSALLAASASQGAAQQIVAVMARATDANGSPLAGVMLTFENLNSGMTRSTVTGSDGVARVGSLPTGQYKVEALLSGFATSSTVFDPGEFSTARLALSDGGGIVIETERLPLPTNTPSPTSRPSGTAQENQEFEVVGIDFTDQISLRKGLLKYGRSGLNLEAIVPCDVAHSLAVVSKYEGDVTGTYFLIMVEWPITATELTDTLEAYKDHRFVGVHRISETRALAVLQAKQ